MITRILLTMVLVLSLTPAPARANVVSKAAREAVEFVLKKFGKKVAAEGAEKLSQKVAAAAARHGDDVLHAVRKIGPKALTLADEAGENAPKVLRLVRRYGDDAARVLSHPKGMAIFARYGDDAAKVLMRHQGIAEPLVETMGGPAVKAFGKLGARNGRRLAMMTKELTASGRSSELLEVIARHGDTAMDFIWRHKATLAGGAVLAAFIANPEPYLSGTEKLVGTVATTTVKPAIEAVAITVKPVMTAAAVAVTPVMQSTGHAVSQGFAFLRWATVVMVILIGLAGFIVVKSGLPWKAATKFAVGQVAKRMLR